MHARYGEFTKFGHEATLAFKKSTEECQSHVLTYSVFNTLAREGGARVSKPSPRANSDRRRVPFAIIIVCGHDGFIFTSCPREILINRKGGKFAIRRISQVPVPVLIARDILYGMHTD